MSKGNDLILSKVGTRRSDGTQWCLDNFDLGKRLGHGRFGSVFVASENRSQFIVALKILHKSEIIASAHHQVQREIDIQFHLHHTNIVRLFGYFHDNKRVYLILEYAPNGSLYSLLQKKQFFKPALAANLLDQLVSALMFIHNYGVIHRDVKPENMLLSGQTLKIADFGWAAPAKSSQLKTYCGTPDYLAPEMLKEGAYGFEVDIWAVGVTLYEFLTGRAPFDSNRDSPTMKTLYKNIGSGRYRLPSTMPNGAKELIQQILCVDPKERLSLQEVKENSWISEQKQLVSPNDFLCD
ncbi:hypothetical protein M3Y94_00517500 [Aphelenchoides besseyi]|nr:hypothetical protein M3Y94_00517500 [Aphelenchoides besseyi]KAI6225992.1 Aurora kinase [Aphelenchoides besseyi]